MMRHLTGFIAVMALSTVLNSQPIQRPEQDFVPEWAKHAIWYQVFPERFRNGDFNNEPTVASLKGSYPQDITSPWQIHPWESDWYKLQPYEKENGKNIWFNLQRRRYGGDIQGMLDALPYIKELGVNALYLNPVFWAPSLHKYDAIVYHHIDPHFGPDPEGDKAIMAQEFLDDPSTWKWTAADKLMLRFLQETKKMGIRVIFDGVFNHMGIESIPFKDVLINQEKSRYKDWFEVTSWENKEKGTEFKYTGWFGVKELPELKEDENGLVAGPKQYIFDITRRWMDPNGDGNPDDGIDGWRLDVAFCVKHQFWKDWRVHVKSLNPQAYITAEVIDPIEVLKPYLEGDEFDAVMNYNFAFTSAEFFFQEKGKILPKEFDKTLADLRTAFPKGVSYVQQNLFGSHDANRIGSAIKNKSIGSYRNWGEYFGLSQATNKKYSTQKPSRSDVEIQKLIALFQMTYVGAPMIYYGDEVGMWGANDPDCRKPMVWDDIEYEAEQTAPDQSRYQSSDAAAQDKDLLAWYKKLIAVRNNHPALRVGSYKTIVTNDKKNLFGFERLYGDEKVIVIINNSNKTQQWIPPVINFVELLSEKRYKTKMPLLIPAKSGLILKPY